MSTTEKPYTRLQEFDSRQDTLAAINAALDECDEINARSKRNGNVSAVDAQRHNTLLQKISLLKSGVSADQWRRAAANDLLIKAGRRPVIYTDALTPERRGLINSYRKIAAGEEIREVQLAGQGIVTYQGGSSGQFVPTEFMYSGLQNALKSHSPLFDPDKVTLITTETGRATQVPLADDTSEKATIVSESISDTTAKNIVRATQIMNYTFMYRTPKIRTAMEFGEDALANYSVNLLESFFAERIARGVGADLMLGSGSGAPLGLINSLVTNGVVPVTAAGSGSDDGGSGNGANSIGSQDLRNLFYSVDRVYRNSSKAAWLMADTTLLAIEGLRDVDKRPLKLIQYVNGQPQLFGKPVYTDPNISPIAVSQATVVFGDLAHWMTRYVPSSGSVKRYKESPGVIEAGLIEWSAFARFGGALLSNGQGATPLNYLTQHS